MKKKQVFLADPDLRDEDIECAVNVLRSGMLVQGKEVEALEQTLSSFLAVKHCVAVSNGTASLHLCLKSLGVSNNDEVIVPAFSYVATANVIELVGAKPIFVDIDFRTNNIDCNKILSAITDKTKAIIPVHEFGLPCNIDEILEIAEKFNLYVIEDAACSLGASIGYKQTGSFGIAGSFSFHPRKAITSGEGGIISTNNDSLAKQLRILRNHGIDSTGNKIEFVEAGFNYRMTDFQAALLNSQFKRFNAILEYKNSLAQIYLNNLNAKHMIIPFVPDGYFHSWQTFHIILNPRFNRDAIIERLKKEEIYTNYGAQCIPSQHYYHKKYSLNAQELYPNALKAYQFGLALPVHEKLTSSDIFNISSTLNKILESC